MAPCVACGACQTPIADELPNSDPSLRKPCPKCGSITRAISVQATDEPKTSDCVTSVLYSYPEKLLGTAKRLFDEGEYSIAVVVAHMACETAVERAMTAAYVAKGITYLENAVDDLLNGYNLANPRIRKLFTAISGKTIAAEPFWQKFTESATRRGKAVHGGLIATKSEAEDSLKATSALIAYLK